MVSICVPAYKKPDFVIRLLDAVLLQDYKEVEVVITDDSPNDDIERAIAPYSGQLTIRYYRNIPALGSPKNWNSAIDRSSGDFFMLVHQDDWFEHPQALSIFISELTKHPTASFVFCKNIAQKADGEYLVLQAIPSLLNRLKSYPNRLLLAQVMGPPSNVMLRAEVKSVVRYDEKLIWLVDVDYNSRLIKEGFDYIYLDQHLMTIGLHKDQTTEFCRDNEDIMFRENIWFAQKIGHSAFRDIKIYDYYWRLLRNYGIRNMHDFCSNKLDPTEMPEPIMFMLKWQSQIPYFMLKFGPSSKLLMAASYFFSAFRK